MSISFQCAPCKSKTVTSKYGPRGGAFHSGLDIAPAAVMTPDTLYVVANGKVKENRFSSTYGYVIAIEHDGWCSVFAHMKMMSVLAVGDIISYGTPCGTMGDTGDSSGTHLHLEVRATNYNASSFWTNEADGRKYKSVDPLPYFDNTLFSGGYGGGYLDSISGIDASEYSSGSSLGSLYAGTQQSLKDAVWGVTETIEDGYGQNEAYFATNKRPYLKKYGLTIQINHRGGQTDTLTGVHLRTVGTEVAADGTPLFEVYEFEARDIKEGSTNT